MFCVGVLLHLALAHASTEQTPLTVEWIMQGYALVGHAPRALLWSPDGSQLRFSWARADGTQEPRVKSYVVNKDGTGLVLAPTNDGPGPAGPPSRGNRFENQSVYESGGDLYIYDWTSKESRRLTQTPETEENPIFVANGTGVIYTVAGNLYRMNFADGKRVRLTDVKDVSTPSAAPTPPDVVVVPIPGGFNKGSLVASPSGDHAWISLSKPAKGVRYADVPAYITESGYPELISTYDRVGSAQSRSESEIVNLHTGATFRIAPARPGSVRQVQWSPDGTHAIVVCRSEDHKDEWIIGFDEKTEKVSMLWDEHCDAWVGGPGRGTVGWYPDGSKFYFVSEQNGFANLYTMPADGGTPTVLVGGKFEVSRVSLDAEHKRFVFTSSDGGPSLRHLDTVGLDGGTPRKLADLSADDDSSYAIAPNGEDVAVVRSKPTHPGELFVGGKQVTTTPTDEWSARTWINPEVVMVPSTDGVSVAARFYKPKNWKRGGPAVIFVHGAGYLQNVFDGWSYYYREYMFHNLLTEHGYMVLDMDYRGSAGYGRDWRTAIYRHMGGKDLDDEVAGAEWLVKQGAGKDRLGIYGGSYGGFLTLMAMFTKPDVFAAGAALRPVADWASYNHGYTSDILNNPQDDKEAYQVSSPINFVGGLKGALLICHGMVDTNVTFQDSVRVVQKLIDLGKTNWQVAPYPVEDHSFVRPSSWTDEYRRIFDLFERNIGDKRR